MDGLRLSAFAIFLMLSPLSKLSCRYFLSFSVKCVYDFILTSVSVFVGSIILHLGRYEIYFFTVALVIIICLPPQDWIEYDAGNAGWE